MEKIIAISNMIDSMHGNIVVDNFEINLQFNAKEGRLLETDNPDTIVIQLQHEDWQRNGMYYEVYIDFRTLRETMTEGEDLDVDIKINNGMDKFESSCMEWISQAKDQLDVI